jgi:CRISPR/Cas system endoribonuclease Cas6 (RAMP superfamily)
MVGYRGSQTNTLIGSSSSRSSIHVGSADQPMAMYLYANLKPSSEFYVDGQRLHVEDINFLIKQERRRQLVKMDWVMPKVLWLIVWEYAS